MGHVLDALNLRPGWRTRFAPAPTGFLHLGHVVNAIYVWGVARAHDGRVVLRIEDHDRSRCRPEYEQALLDDLDWLGFTPDEGTTAEFRAGTSALRQSDDDWRYAAAITALEIRGLVYPCRCSRGDIARLVEDRPNEEMRYPGTCRDAAIPPDASMQRRVKLGSERERFFDLLRGPQEQVPAEQCGDVLVRDRLGQWTYQFAVTVDDLDQTIDVVIRGEDLLESTGRQRALARLLGRRRPLHFMHHPLVRHTDGAKLSKSAGDSGVRELRAAGITPAEVLGRAAHAVGLIEQARPIALDEIPRFFADQ
ncbi:MAG: glutamate--tRNA ligase family protein [Gemmatimonadaceae bacterium]|nr:glutamate--tRNA ligase family protein [Gemmatimonadaceae bacterium]